MFSIKEFFKSIPKQVKIAGGIIIAGAAIFCLVWFDIASKETIVITAISLGLFLLVVLIHELGHFSFARLFDVNVIEFAIGMGPKLWSKRGKKHNGETLYSVRAFPIGGFCLMEGEDGDYSDNGEASDETGDIEVVHEPSERALFRKKPWQRAAILAAGAVFNIILGFIFMLIVQAQQPAYASNTISGFGPTDEISEEEYLAASDSELYFIYEKDGKTHYLRHDLSSRTGLQAGDTILTVDGSRTLCFDDIAFSIAMSNDGIVDFTVIRDGEKIELKGVQFYRGRDEKSGFEYTIRDFYVERIPRTFGSMMSQTYYRSVFMMKSVYVSLWRMVSGQGSMNEMSGPIGIASIIGEAAQQGFAESVAKGVNNILDIMALITFNLGIFNLLPFPALDGSRLIFVLLEAIRKKPIPSKWEGLIHGIGFMLLIGLMILITFKDLISCFPK